MKTANDVGEYIKKLREEKGLTQEQLGQIVGVQKAAVQKWENGTTKNLKRKAIKTLSEYFNVSPANFVTDSGWEKPTLSKTEKELLDYMKKNPDIMVAFTTAKDSNLTPAQKETLSAIMMAYVKSTKDNNEQ